MRLRFERQSQYLPKDATEGPIISQLEEDRGCQIRVQLGHFNEKLNDGCSALQPLLHAVDPT